MALFPPVVRRLAFPIGCLVLLFLSYPHLFSRFSSGIPRADTSDQLYIMSILQYLIHTPLDMAYHLPYFYPSAFVATYGHPSLRDRAHLQGLPAAGVEPDPERQPLYRPGADGGDSRMLRPDPGGLRRTPAGPRRSPFSISSARATMSTSSGPQLPVQFLDPLDHLSLPEVLPLGLPALSCRGAFVSTSSLPRSITVST